MFMRVNWGFKYVAFFEVTNCDLKFGAFSAGKPPVFPCKGLIMVKWSQFATSYHGIANCDTLFWRSWMADKLIVLDEEGIKSRIHTIRGQQIILDKDLAELYNVETKVLNQAVKRNSGRFPKSFRFQLTSSEAEILKSQFVTSSWGGKRKLPYAFTEQGVAMLSGVLKSETAIKVSIRIMNTFVAMRRFLASNAQVFYRLDKVENKQIEHDRKFDQVFRAIESRDIKPKKGVFYSGQVFDAYLFVSDIIRSAERSIILIDNYVDDSVLMLLCKRKEGVSAKIYTRDVSKQLRQDLEKCNSQYPPIEVVRFSDSHDRFLIIDNIEVYHIGASLKDLGKKWFAFSRIDKEAFGMVERLGAI
jgi:hypothetical protein